MRTTVTVLVALTLSACVDFEPTTGPLAHAAGSCGSTSEYPTEGYPPADAGKADAGCPTSAARDAGYY